MTKFGLIGYPIEHSFSKAFFEDKFRDEGIEASYELFPIENIEGIHTLIRRNPHLAGLNVTMPHKQHVIPLLDMLDPIATNIQAVNTIKITRIGEKTILKGYNTDVAGFKRAFLEFTKGKKGKCLILGTGGAAKAVAYALEDLNMSYKLVTRKESLPGKINYKQINRKVLETFTIIINTTPLGMVPSIKEHPDIPYDYLSDDHYLFDLIYNPVETSFLRKGKERGCKINNGMNMLIYQAIESWRIWHDR